MLSVSKAKTKSVHKHIIITNLVIIVGVVFLVVNTRPSPFSTVVINGDTITVEVADDLIERKAGLSGRDGIANNHGMLFVFDKPDKHGFWMKDMKFSIDMVWLDETSRVVQIEKNVKPSSYPTVYYPNVDDKYVLEMYSGQAEEHRLRIGDMVQINLL